MKNLIFVVMHKKYEVPHFPPYKSISVGFKKNTFKTDYNDALGNDNISRKNATYCELTAQYWIWKNIADKYDNIGLNHYRRYFGNSNLQYNVLLKNNKISKYLKTHDIILPKPWYWKMTVAEKYYIDGYGKKKDLKTTRDAIKKYYPEYISSFDYILKQHSASYCNMLVTNRKNFKNYNIWLFTILTYVEKNTNLSNYTLPEKRVFGYLSEILLNVWVHKNQLKVKYLPMIQKENTIFYKFKTNIKFLFIKYIYLKWINK